METTILPLSRLRLNTGQISGLPKNPRFIRDDKFERLKKSLQDDPELMEVRPIVAYDNGGELVIVGGNMRYRALKDMGEKDAHVIVLPQETPVEKLRAFTIKDNVGYGEWSWDDLANEWPEEELSDWGVDVPVVQEKTNYTREVVPPVYEPKGEKPSLSDLEDGEKVNELIKEIEDADVDDEVKSFLRFAAERHRVFHYNKIAEYYSHADEKIQMPQFRAYCRRSGEKRKRYEWTGKPNSNKP